MAMIPDRLMQESLPHRLNLLTEPQASLEALEASFMGAFSSNYDDIANLQPDPDMNLAPTGWRSTSQRQPLAGTESVGPNISSSTTVRPGSSGTKSLWVYTSGSSGIPTFSAEGSEFPVSEYQEYAVSFWEKVYSTSHTVYMYLNWYNASGGWLGSSNYYTFSNGADWTQRSFVAGPSPKGATRARVAILTRIQTSNTTGGFYDELLVTPYHGWSSHSSAASISHAPGQGRTGAGALSFASSGTDVSPTLVERRPVQPAGKSTYPSDTAWGQVVTTAGEQIEVRGWLRPSDVARSYRAGIAFYDKTGGLLTIDYGQPILGVVGDWVEAVTSAESPPGAAFARAAFQVMNVSVSGEVHYLDDVKFNRSHGWYPTTNVTLSRSTARAYSGSASLALSATNSGDMTAGSIGGVDGATVEAGISYFGSVMVLPATTQRNVRADLYWYNSAGAKIGETPGPAVAVQTGFSRSSWTPVHVIGTAPDGAVTASLHLTVLGAAQNEVVYLDTASVATILYQATSDVILKQLVLCNVSGLTESVTLSLVSGGEAETTKSRFFHNVGVAPGAPIVFDATQVMKTGDLLVGAASSLGGVSLLGSGVIVTA